MDKKENPDRHRTGWFGKKLAQRGNTWQEAKELTVNRK